jgi:hypothetical protein
MLTNFKKVASGCSFSLREKVRMRGNAALPSGADAFFRRFKYYDHPNPTR